MCLTAAAKLSPNSQVGWRFCFCVCACVCVVLVGEPIACVPWRGVCHRKRVYVVAIRQDSLRHEFKFPEPVPLRRRVKQIVVKKSSDKPKNSRPSTARERRLVNTAFTKVKRRGVNPYKTPVLIDIGCSPAFASHGVGIMPCMTATRAQTCGAGYWCSTAGRTLTLEEVMQFQGFSTSQVADILAAIDNAPADQATSLTPKTCKSSIIVCLGSVDLAPIKV